MAKIIGIISSPHKNGVSATLAREVLKSAEKRGSLTEEIYLPDYNIKFCKGCMACLSGSKCILDDDLNYLRDLLLDFDGIVLSSPTYALSPNAMMMNFMQRAGIYSVYRSSLAGKYLIGISSAGRFGAKKVAKELSKFADGLFKAGKKVGIIGARGGIDNLKSYKKKAKKLGKKLVRDIEKNRKYRFQGLFIKFMGALFMHKIMKKNLTKNKNDSMKGVYESLVKSGIISVG